MTKKLTEEEKTRRAAERKAPAPKAPVAEPKSKKRAVQGTLAGVVDDKDEELTELALVYVDVRDRRMDLTKEERAAKEKLHEAMKSKRMKRYHDAEARILVEIVQVDETVKVVFGGGDKDEDDE